MAVLIGRYQTTELNVNRQHGRKHKKVRNEWLELGGGLIGYVKSKPLGNGQIISIDVLVVVMIIAVFHEKLI